MSKRDFDRAVKNAQEALRAKTVSSQQMLTQASSAMRNAVTALSLSEQEVANLRASVAEMRARDEANTDANGEAPATDKERAQLRAAQARLQELSTNFRTLQSEVARHRYQQVGTHMPVASSFPVRIDPMLSSKVVCIAQLVMLGYSYGDAENSLDAVRVNDTIVALEWLEDRRVVKIVMLGSGESAALRSAFQNTAANVGQLTGLTATTENTASTLYKETSLNTSHSEAIVTHDATRGLTSVLKSNAVATGSDFQKGARTTRGFNANEMYAARKRAVMMLVRVARFPNPGTLFYLSTGDCCLYISIYSSCDGTCYLCPDCLSMHRDTQDVNHFSCNNHRPCSR